MTLLTETEINAMLASISATLSTTDLACASIAQLSGGTTNFVFRGYLSRPFMNRSSVIIKHAAPFISCNKDYPIDDTRAEFEEIMLTALDGGSRIKAVDNEEQDVEAVEVRTPRLWYYNRPEKLQVLEDFPDTVTLNAALPNLDRDRATSMARALGAWLRALHGWSSASELDDLQSMLLKNQEMRKLKRKITYSAFLPVLENFPEVLEPHRKTLEAVQEAIGREFENPGARKPEADFGIIHGDFWAGNILIPSNANPPHLVVIDWEFTQISHRSVDLGEFLGDLYERHYYDHTSSVPCFCLSAISSFISGYGPMSEELAFRTAIYAGIHLVCWATRGTPGFWRNWPQDRVAEGMKIGVEWIVKGWENDKEWFESSMLAGLFKGV